MSLLVVVGSAFLSNALHCERGYTESMGLYHKSSLNNYYLNVEVNSGTDGKQALSVSLDDVSFSWDLLADKNISTTNGQNIAFDVEKENLDSLTLNSTTFYKIMKFTIVKPENLGIHQPKVFYLAQHYGVIKYEEAGGVVWERE